MTTTSTLQHAALPYSGPGGFVELACAAVDRALSAGGLPVVLADPGSIAAVRGHLAGRDEVLGVDMTVAGRNPARLVPALQHLLDEHPDRRLFCIGEPLRGDPTVDVVRESALHELLLALPAFAHWNAELVCAYDRDGLPADVASGIEAVHETGHVDPVDRFELARAEHLPPRPNHCEELGVDRTTLSALRGFINTRSLKAGLDDERADDLVYAVNEVVTNSICHGEGRARVGFWIEPGGVRCEVRDRGWIRDPLAGRVRPRADDASGRGLWLVNQLCDLVALRSSPAGTTVRLYIDL